MEKYLSCVEFLKSQNLLRSLSYEAKQELDFTSNDYLCLSKNANVINAGFDYVLKFGVGAKSSRVLMDNSQYLYLEEKIAQIKQKESCIVFPSGYQLNSSIIASLLDKSIVGDVTVLSDRLNHNSIHTGILLSGQKQVRYNNVDMAHLEKKLQQINNTLPEKQIYVITESVFSMDGTVIDIDKLALLRKKYNFILYVDDAHGFGVIGDNGAGICSENIDIVAGTFSKAIGGMGGYVASNKTIINYLITKCNGFIYSTGLSPFHTGASLGAINEIANLKIERRKLLQLAQYARDQIINNSLVTNDSHSNIIPIFFNTNEEILEIQKHLASRNIHVSAIRKPTSPTPRIRISLNVSHTQICIDKLIFELKQCI